MSRLSRSEQLAAGHLVDLVANHPALARHLSTRVLVTSALYTLAIGASDPLQDAPDESADVRAARMVRAYLRTAQTQGRRCSKPRLCFALPVRAHLQDVPEEFSILARVEPGETPGDVPDVVLSLAPVAFD